MGKYSFSNPEFYNNRELSWLLFEERVLAEAKDRSYPLLDRLKFLSITSSNLDEFFMIRVASLKEMEKVRYTGLDISGMTPTEQLFMVSVFAHKLILKQYETYNNDVLAGLEQKKIKVVTHHEHLTSAEAHFVDQYFDLHVFPILTPMLVRENMEFPFISSRSINLGLLIQNKESLEKLFAFVEVPKTINRVVEIETSSDDIVLILLEEIIERNVYKLFSKYNILGSDFFRIIRNADLNISNDECADLITEIEEQIRLRQWGDPIRLDMESEMDFGLKDLLLKELSLSEEDCYTINGPLDLTFLLEIYGIEKVSKLRNPSHEPIIPTSIDSKRSLFEQISENDIMLFHPYESFKPVIDFIIEASNDPNVLAIKQTLYRVSDNSPIVGALAKAAKNGKQVTVLVELKARFDEENNIGFARVLEKAGAHVIYGVPRLKTHCKITEVIKNENNTLKYYVHLGTGNYNDTTARLYTDIGLFTSNKLFGEDANKIFNMLAGGNDIDELNVLTVAPKNLRNRFIELIEREAENARLNKPAKIIAKLNSLCDKAIIDALYNASLCGVKIELIVRGICCLKASVAGLSENITVRSIVGMFLEHSRMFYFENGGNPEVYCASSDWMPRNFDRRVEILFPIFDEPIKKRIIAILNAMLKDTRKARIMKPDGTYEILDKDPDNEYSFQTSMIEEIKTLF